MPGLNEHDVCDLVPGSEYTMQIFTTIETDTGRIESDKLEITTSTCKCLC